MTGLWLFTVKPREYLENEAFLWKMALLALALVNIAVQHRNHHYRLALDGGAVHLSVRLVAGCSSGAVARRAGRRAVGRVSVTSRCLRGA